jgi:hypothetical protein
VYLSREWSGCLLSAVCSLPFPGSFYLAFGLLLSGLSFIGTESQIAQCFAQAIACGKSLQKRGAGHVGKSWTQILLEPRGSNVMSKLQLRVCYQSCLVTSAEIIRIHAQRMGHTRMFSQLTIGVSQIVAGEPRPLKTRI